MRVLSGVPFLPSLITLGNAFCGFLSIAYVLDVAFRVGNSPLEAADLPAIFGKLEAAGALIFLAMIFDALDGKVARLTDQTSDFGAQLDSLADAITFGVAPAVLVKCMIDLHQSPHGTLLPHHPKLYYLCAALYALCAVMRLARFNVETAGHEERAHVEFYGLPTPAAAAVICSVLLFSFGRFEQNSLSTLIFGSGIYGWLIRGLPFLLFGCGLLMVSRLPYPHLMNTLLRGRKSFLSLALAVFVLVLAALEWQIVLLTLCVLYLLTGPFLGLFRMLFGGTPVGEAVLDEEAGDYDFEEDEEVFEEEEWEDRGTRDEGGEEPAPPVRRFEGRGGS